MLISILNAGGQIDYLYGLVSGLSQIESIELEVIDADRSVGLIDKFPYTHLLNLRGDNLSPQSLWIKSWRIGRYYLRLLRYAVVTKSKLFHIQWENSLELFDRTLLNLFYKLLGKKLVYTAHNVYKEARDGRDNIIRWFSLKCLYHFVDRIIVHTPKMKEELCSLFRISPDKVVIIPFGINNFMPRSGMQCGEARAKLGIGMNAKVVLFFGLVDEYKGVETLVDAVARLLKKDSSVFLVIAGKPKRQSSYVPALKNLIFQNLPASSILLHMEYIPIHDVEMFFSAADCLVLPYKWIFQSSVIFLSYRYGIPIIATNVGNFSEDIVDVPQDSFASRMIR